MLSLAVILLATFAAATPMAQGPPPPPVGPPQPRVHHVGTGDDLTNDCDRRYNVQTYHKVGGVAPAQQDCQDLANQFYAGWYAAKAFNVNATPKNFTQKTCEFDVWVENNEWARVGKDDAGNLIESAMADLVKYATDTAHGVISYVYKEDGDVPCYINQDIPAAAHWVVRTPDYAEGVVPVPT